MKQNTLGFSLIEIMVSIGIFAILLLSILSIAQSVSNGQKAAIAAQNTQESLRFAFEVMSKEMRSAKERDAKSDCDPSGNDTDNKILNMGTIGSEDALYFINKDDQCVYYYLENDINTIPHLKIARGNNFTDATTDNDFYITPNDVKITSLKFSIKDNKIGNIFSQKIQSLLTIKMDFESAGSKFKQSDTMQTTVSLRHY